MYFNSFNVNLSCFFLISDDDYSKFTSKDISDYDAEYDLLPNKKARKRRPKNNKPNKNIFWMNDQMQKVKHHTKGINLESPLDPKQGLMLSF